ncbi:MAG: DNA-binding response regulator [Epulopiscium sp. Nele67-Bin005]|nr:MAG: DNA-binding response regulator [Epulopiscium sp. Nele67-Bin005]
MSDINILVVDDESRMRKIVGDFLKREGYTPIEAADGREALQIIEQRPEQIDLILLDVMMPYYNGWEVLKQLRPKYEIPVIMLTAKCEEYDQLQAFSSGADDFIAKPFSPMLLMARIKAILKRTAPISDIAQSQEDGLFINREARRVYLEGEELTLTFKEYELLVYLQDNKHIALTREQILDGVWQYDYFGNLRTVDTHIKQLRAKLKDKSEYIRTVRGVGYLYQEDLT